MAYLQLLLTDARTHRKKRMLEQPPFISSLCNIWRVPPCVAACRIVGALILTDPSWPVNASKKNLFAALGIRRENVSAQSISHVPVVLSDTYSWLRFPKQLFLLPNRVLFSCRKTHLVKPLPLCYETQFYDDILS